MIESQYPDKGKLWSEDEESLLIEELYNNIDVETIARNHGRTIGGIISRRSKIAYNMYLNNSTMETIIKWTKLDEKSINQIIKKKSGSKSVTIKENKPIKISKNDDNEDDNSVNTHLTLIIEDISNMKKDIMTMKKDMKTLKITMMRSFCEIKDVSESPNTFSEII